MAFLIKQDLFTHIYPELLDEIIRTDDTIIERSISAAIAETKSYLSRYDLDALFGTNNTNKTINSEHLNNIVKDIACWSIIRLANPNIDLKLFRTAYEDSIRFLTLVQKGQADPDGWTYKPDDPNTTDNNENNSIKWSSNKKRTQHF